ncbi:MAG: MBL fold metallo-hydrolase [Candidatus Nanopelagicales bacterium]|jgi:glyoxylase-like metal-dependent hydrolase (beta-lactamase superfamily II)
MTGMIGPPGFAGEWFGGEITAHATCVLAPNAGPQTLDGTNTWLIGAPGSTGLSVIDPGPNDVAHWQVVAAEVQARGARIERILLTHGHLDHSAGARMFAEAAGCEVQALDPAHQYGSEGLTGGEVLELSGIEIHVVATPGHSSDSLSFHLPQDGSLLTGDTVLGRGTTVVAYPDGTLVEYLDSLHRLRELVHESDLSRILPGHGPTLDQPGAVIDYYLAHRQERLEQVRAVVTELGSHGLPIQDLAQRVVETVYADVPKSVWPLALLSVRAQLEYLATHG